MKIKITREQLAKLSKGWIIPSENVVLSSKEKWMCFPETITLEIPDKQVEKEGLGCKKDDCKLHADFNCLCKCHSEPQKDWEKEVADFERKFGGMIMTQSKRDKQDKDNEWLRNLLSTQRQEGYDEGRKLSVHDNMITGAVEETRQATILECIEVLEKELKQSCGNLDCIDMPRKCERKLTLTTAIKKLKAKMEKV